MCVFVSLVLTVYINIYIYSWFMHSQIKDGELFIKKPQQPMTFLNVESLFGNEHRLDICFKAFLSGCKLIDLDIA